MVGLTTYTASAQLQWMTGKVAFPALPTAYIALFTAVGADTGAGFTEVSGGGYARVATTGATWNAPSGQSPSAISNVLAITFPASTATWGTVIAFGIYDAASGGNLLFWDYLGGYAWVPFTCTNGSPGVLTSPAHGYGNGDVIVVTSEFGGGLPATSGSWAGLLTVAGVTADTFNVNVNTLSTGDGTVRKIATQIIGSGITTSFSGGAPGALVLTAA